MRAPALYAALLALLACGDALAPVSVGAVYQLRNINGQPLPRNPPSDDSAYLPMMVTEGWIKFLDDRASNARALGTLGDERER